MAPLTEYERLNGTRERPVFSSLMKRVVGYTKGSMQPLRIRGSESIEWTYPHCYDHTPNELASLVDPGPGGVKDIYVPPTDQLH